jgi:hypothetical protein
MLAIDDDMNAAALSVENLLSGNLPAKDTADEEFALVHTLEDFKSRLSERNPYGEYNLTGAQSAAQVRKMQGVMYGSAVNHFNGLPEESKPEAARRVLEDKAFAGRSQNLKDLLYPNDYGKLKSLARGFLDRYEKELAKGATSADASAVSNEQVLTMAALEDRMSVIKTKDKPLDAAAGKAKDFKNATPDDIFSIRYDATAGYLSHKLSEDDYAKIMKDTQIPLMRAIDQIKAMSKDNLLWFDHETAFQVGFGGIEKFIEDQDIRDPSHKAFLYSYVWDEFNRRRMAHEIDKSKPEFDPQSSGKDEVNAAMLTYQGAISAFKQKILGPAASEKASAAILGTDMIQFMRASGATKAPFALEYDPGSKSSYRVYPTGESVLLPKKGK